jgi:hypothetical protein
MKCLDLKGFVQSLTLSVKVSDVKAKVNVKSIFRAVL